MEPPATATAATDESFAPALLRWFDIHGRHDLPWQHNRTPYRVWLSEIMLQQTQVTTVIPYFQHFVATFPDIASLATAPIDDVLALWSGLGYYARARNLHQAAQRMVEHAAGTMPRDHAELTNLPGIGRSTASAILAQAHDLRHTILDGNVKRVLARYHMVGGWTSNKAVENKLWALAEQHTPHARVRDYTQAIMDLGATVCTRSRPQCAVCPLRTGCQAYATQQVTAFPQTKPSKAVPLRHTVMLVIRDDHGRILLQRRPPTGIWGGLWSLPECAPAEDIHPFCAQQLGLAVTTENTMPTFSHTFSHFVLHITPQLARMQAPLSVMDDTQHAWYNLAQARKLGLPAPVKKLLSAMTTKDTHDPQNTLRQTAKRSRRPHHPALPR